MDKNIQAMADHWSKLLICTIVVLNIRVQATGFMNITYIESAVAKGAVCLDGSPPAYSYGKGSGDGANNWVVYIEGGAWCGTESDCIVRRGGMFGSTLNKPGNNTFFSGILDNNQTFNPEFYNWNRVYLLYCDGASFMADIEEVDPKTKLFYRGARVFDAIMEDLLAKGMKDADNVVLAGTSAGGLATILHCDKFAALLPNAGRVKCIADSGFFIHAKNLPGAKFREQRFANVVATHRLSKSLPTSCTSKMDPGLCLFPENLVRDIQTPLFLVEAAFERWQIEENLIPTVGGKPQWSNCTTNLTRCTSTEIQIMQDFRTTFIETLQRAVGNSSSCRGMFVHSCYLHGHIPTKEQWKCSSAAGHNVLADKSIAKAIGDWYFDRSNFEEIDFQNDLPRDCTNYLGFQEFNFECLRHKE